MLFLKECGPPGGVGTVSGLSFGVGGQVVSFGRSKEGGHGIGYLVWDAAVVTVT